MQNNIQQNCKSHLVSVLLVLLAFMLTMPACKKPPHHQQNYEQVNLVGNNDEYGAMRIDPAFKNGWGISFSSGGIAWVSAANTGLSEVWNSTGAEVRPAVTIPSPGDAGMGGHPSGQVFNSTTDFKLPNGNPARFIFAGLDGVISGWNGENAAVVAIDDSKAHAVYTGIALATDNTGANFLYAANFSAGKIDVYDKDWKEVDKPFWDPHIPVGYSPFNIQNINGKLFVMYAKVGSDGKEQKGQGLGYVDVFNPNGALEKRFASRGQLNAPWGVAAAPMGFWNDKNGDAMANVILIGNFGDGRINAYDQWGNFLGPLKSNGKPIWIDGLWGISFVPATATTVDPGWLFFAAGPDEEADGLFGYIKKVSKE